MTTLLERSLEAATTYFRGSNPRRVRIKAVDERGTEYDFTLDEGVSARLPFAYQQYYIRPVLTGVHISSEHATKRAINITHIGFNANFKQLLFIIDFDGQSIERHILSQPLTKLELVDA